jgi:hypothetical protein
MCQTIPSSEVDGMGFVEQSQNPLVSIRCTVGLVKIILREFLDHIWRDYLTRLYERVKNANTLREIF